MSRFGNLLYRLRRGPEYSWQSRTWQRNARRLLRSFVSSGDLVLDVGANVGGYCELFLSLGARVVAVEPQPGCVEQLRERFGSRIQLVPAAAGAATGEAELLVATYSTVSSLSPDWVETALTEELFPGIAWNDRVTVPVVTLDSLIEEYGVPTFCKIDVEGYEPQVLQGLSRPIPALSFESHPAHTSSALTCLEELERLSISRFNASEGTSMRLHWSEWRGREEMDRALREREANATFWDVYARR